MRARLRLRALAPPRSPASLRCAALRRRWEGRAAIASQRSHGRHGTLTRRLRLPHARSARANSRAGASSPPWRVPQPRAKDVPHASQHSSVEALAAPGSSGSVVQGQALLAGTGGAIWVRLRAQPATWRSRLRAQPATWRSRLRAQPATWRSRLRAQPATWRSRRRAQPASTERVEPRGIEPLLAAPTRRRYAPAVFTNAVLARLPRAAANLLGRATRAARDGGRQRRALRLGFPLRSHAPRSHSRAGAGASYAVLTPSG